MNTAILAALVAGLPVVVAILEWAGSDDMGERHHGHHDTYIVPHTLTRVLVAAMVAMAVVGLVVAWLCSSRVLDGDADMVLGFFAAFLAAMLVVWVVKRRQKLMTYDDRMVVTPGAGRTRTVRYADIERMEWTSRVIGTGASNLRVCVRGERPVLLSDAYDLDQILERIDRYDVLEVADGDEGA